MTSENGSFCDRRISRRKLASAFLAIGVIALLAVALVPVDKSSANPTREGGACSGCHSGA
jgi:hypothetical protein